MPLKRLSPRTRDWLLLSWVIFFTALVFYGVMENRQRSLQNHQLADQAKALNIKQQEQIKTIKTLVVEGRKAFDGLCTLREDLERRVVTARKFLEENPDGIPGITAATIRSSINNQEATLESLSNLDCEI